VSLSPFILVFVEKRFLLKIHDATCEVSGDVADLKSRVPSERKPHQFNATVATFHVVNAVPCQEERKRRFKKG
jgi:hypothetical protein